MLVLVLIIQVIGMQSFHLAQNSKKRSKHIWPAVLRYNIFRTRPTKELQKTPHQNKNLFKKKPRLFVDVSPQNTTDMKVHWNSRLLGKKS